MTQMINQSNYHDRPQRIFSPDPVSPLLMEDPKQVVAYLTEMRRHLLAQAAACERMLVDLKARLDGHDMVR